jgi:hypothetical protein
VGNREISEMKVGKYMVKGEISEMKMGRGVKMMNVDKMNDMM